MNKIFTSLTKISAIIGITAFAFVGKVEGQSTANYTFATNATGSLAADLNSNTVDMTTGTTTAVAADVDNGVLAATNIGFDFFFYGARYTQFSATSNGLIGLGGTAVSNATYLASGGSTTTPRLGAFVADLRTGISGKVHYKVVGTAPNRCLVVEFLNMSLMYVGTPGSSDGTYQVRLYETTGVVEYVYGAMARNAGTLCSTCTPTIGFSVGTLINQTASVTTSTHTCSNAATFNSNTYSTSTTITDLNSAANGSRRNYRWTPTSLTTPSGLGFTGVTGTAMNVNWTDNATGELGYVLYNSTDGTNFTYVTTTAANAATYAATGLSYGTTYTWRVYVLRESLGTALSGSQATTAGTLSGTKTVGSGGTYNNLTLAFAAINASGLSGNVNLQLITGYPAVAETYPIVSSTASAVGPYTVTVYPTVTGLSITSNNATGTLNLNAAKNLTFDGRVNATGSTADLVIANTNPGTSYAVQFINDANTNTLRYCNIKSGNSSATSGTVVFAAGTTNGNDNNNINNCKISGNTPGSFTFTGSAATTTLTVTVAGSSPFAIGQAITGGAFAAGTIITAFGTGTGGTGTYTINVSTTQASTTLTSSGQSYPANAIYSNGTSAAVDNSSNTINANNIFDYYHPTVVTSGILLNSTGNSTWTITNNRLYQQANRLYTAGQTHQGISINTGGGYTITGNIVGFANSSGTGTTGLIGNSIALGGTFPTSFTTAGSSNVTRYIGIYGGFTAGGTTSSIQNNTVAGIALYTSSGATTTYGILNGIMIASGSADVGTTTGNTIGATSGQSSLYACSTIAGGTVVGIYATSSNTVNIQNNNIGAIDAVATTTTNSGAFTGIDVAGTGVYTINSNTIGSTAANNIRTGYTVNGANLGTSGSVITSTTGTTSPMVGIRHTASGASVTINSNTLQGWQNGTTGGGALTGITTSGAVTSSVTINGNFLGTSTRGWMTWTFANTGGTVTGISATSATSATTHSIQTNDFRGLVYTVSGSSAHTYITLTGATAAANTATISSNTFTNLSVNTTGSITFISHTYTVAATGTQTISSNSIATGFNKTAAGGTITLATSSASSAAGATINHTSNNFSNITVTGATTIAGWISSDGGAANKTYNGNTFSNWTGGSSGVTVMDINFGGNNGGNGNAITNNTISTISGTGAVTGITAGNSATRSTISGNNISGLSGGAAVVAISAATPTSVISTNTIGTLSSTATSVTGINFGSAATGTVDGNTISGLTGAVATMNGISCTATTTGNVSNNTISGLATSLSSTVSGIAFSQGTQNIFRNKLYDLSSSVASSTVVGINNVPNVATTSNISNNLIGDLRVTASTNATGILGIYLNILNTSQNNIYYNTIYLNNTSAGTTAGSAGIYTTASSTAASTALNLRNNIIVNTSTPGSSSGSTVAYRRSVGTAGALANYSSTSNNNLFYAGTPGANNLIYYDGTSNAQTIAAYKAGVFTAGTISPRDQASVSEMPTFLSTTGSSANFLHIATTPSSQIESGGAAISGFTDDFDATAVRTGYPLAGQANGGGSAPDIGADEYDGSPVIPSVTSTSTPTITCTATAHTVTATSTTPAGTITAMNITYNNGSLNSAVAMTYVSGSGTGPYTYSFSIPAASPSNTAVTWSVTATNSAGITSGTTSGTGYTDDPLGGVTATATASPTTICAGTPTTLTATLTKNQTTALGAGGSTSAASGSSMFNGTYGGLKTQYIVKASELTALGFSAGSITALGFEPTTSGQAYQGFTLSIGNTALSTMVATVQTSGLTQVYAGTGTNGGFTPTSGSLNTLTFGTGSGSSSSFTWDGTSNLLLSFCWSSNPTASTATSTTVKVDAPGFTCTGYFQSDNLLPAAFCGLTSGFGTTGTGTNRPKFTWTINMAPTPSAYLWSNSAGSAASVSVSPSTNPGYTCQITASGCNVTTPAATLTVNPATTSPTNTSTAAQCGTSATYTITTAVSSPTIKWYTAASGGSAISGATATSYTATGLSAGLNSRWATVTDATGCESARVQCNVTLSTADPLTASVSPTGTICANSPIDLSVSQTGSTNTYVLTWTASPASNSGIPTSTSGSLVTPTTVTPLAAGSPFAYTVTGTESSTGCSTTSTINVTVINPNTGVTATATATPSTVCSGSPTSLSVVVGASGTVAIGAGGSTSTSAPYNPFNGTYGGEKGTYLIRASELTTAGFIAGNITAVALDFSGAGTTYSGFGISIGNTALTALTTSTIETGLTSVYSAATVTPTVGVNTYTLSTPFNWNGTSNIIIATCWSNNNTSNTSSTIKYDAVGFQASVSYRKDSETSTNMCSFTGATGAGTSTFDNSSNRPKFVITGNVSSTPSAYSWSDGSGTVGTTNPLSQSPTSNTTYTCTATRSGCPVVSNGVTVTTNTLPNAPSANVASSTQCGAAVPTVSVSGTAGQMRWYDGNTGGATLLQTGGLTYTSSVSSTQTLYVGVNNGTCETAPASRTALSVTVNAADALTAAVTPTGNICLGSSISLSVTQSGGNGNTYTLTWAAAGAGSGLTSPAAGALSPTTLSVTPTVIGVYTYTINGTASGGCAGTSSVNVTVINPNVGITATATATPSTVCSGSPTSLSVLVGAPSSRVIGSGTGNSSSSPTPFSGVYGGMKGQYILLGSELTGAGLTAGNITAIGINFLSNVTATYTGLTIQLGTTALSAFPGTLSLESTGLATYYGPTNLVNPTAGVNTFTLSTPFVWDGSSNIIISTNWSNNTTTSTSAAVIITTTGFNSAQIHKRDSYTPAALLALTGTQVGGSSTVGTSRPNFTISGNTGSTPSAFSWSTAAPTVVGTTNPLSQSPTIATSYFCNATVNGCPITSNTVAVAVNALPTTPTDNSSTPQCATDATFSISTGVSSPTYKWYTASSGGTAIVGATASTYALTPGAGAVGGGATNTRWATVTNTNGCESARVQCDVVLNSADALTASVSPTGSICLGSPIDLSVVQSGSTQTYSLAWTASPASGSGIATSAAGSLVTPTTVTPTAANTYVYTITGTGGGCTATSTVSVTVINPNAGITATAAATPSNVCAGGSTDLSVTLGSSGGGGGSVPTGYTTTGLGGASTPFISLFTLNTINYTASSGALSPFYKAMAATGANTTTLVPGQSYTATLTAASSGIASIWVDFNRNGAFDASEWFQPYSTGTTGSVSVVVPGGASIGATMMRIRTRNTTPNGSGDANSNFFSGEVIDFTVNISPAPSAYSWSDGSSTVGTTNPLTQSPSGNTNYTCNVTVNGCPVVSSAAAVVIVPTTVSPNPAGSVSLSGQTASVINGTITAGSPASVGYLVVRSTSSTLSASPADGTTYAAAASLGGGTVVQSSTSTTFTNTALTSNTQYYFFVFAYNDDGCDGIKYSSSITNNTFTCPAAPTALAVSGITGSNGTVSWTAPAGAGALTYTVQYKLTSSGTWLTAATGVSASPYTLTVLSSPTTSYDVQISASNSVCTGVFSTTLTFTSACTNGTLTLSEGFNTSGTAVFPTCWSQEYVVGTRNITFQTSSTLPTASPQEGTRFVKWNSFASGSAGKESRLISRPLTTTGTANVDVNFMWFNENNSTYSAGAYLNEGVQVQYSLDGSTWIDAGTLFPRHDATAGSGLWNAKYVTLPAGAGNQPTIFVAFKFHAEAGENCYLDAVSISPTIPRLSSTSLAAFGAKCNNNVSGPNSFTLTGTALTTANITVGPLAGYTFSTTSGGTYTSSLSLAHSAGSYSQDIYVKFTPTAIQSYNGNIAVAGGGVASFNVAASGSSTWGATATSTSGCTPAQLTGGYTGNLTTTLLSETFESYTAGLLNTTTTPWREYLISGAFSYSFWEFATCTPITGSKSMTLYNDYYGTDCDYDDGSSIQFVSYYPTRLDATSLTNLLLNFKWKGTGENTGATIYDYGQVVYSLDASSPTNWTALPTKYYGQSATQTVANLSLGVLDGQQFYFGFQWINDASTAGTPFKVDDITITGDNANPTYSWAAASGSPTYTPSSAVQSPTTNTTATYTVSATSGTCVSTATTSITVDQTSVAGTINGSGTVCVGQSVTLSVTGQVGTVQQWEVATAASTGPFTVVSGSAGQTTISPVTTALGNQWYRVSVKNGACVAVYSTTVSLVTAVNCLHTWTGALSQNWNTAGNWTPPSIPTSGDPVVIPNVTNDPIIGFYGNYVAYCDDLSVSSGATIGFYGNPSISSLTIYGTIITMANNTVYGPGVVNFGSTTPISMTITGGANFNNDRVEISAGSTLKLLGSTDMTVHKALRVNNGATLYSNGSNGATSTLHFADDISGNYTSLIDYNSGAALGTILGDVTVDRLLASGVGYKYLSSPIQNRLDQWVDDFPIIGANNHPSNLYTNPWPNIWRYDETNTNSNQSYGWISSTGTTTNFSYASGYACILTAPISIDLTGLLMVQTSASANTDQTKSVTFTNSGTPLSDGWNLLGNPFVAPLDFNSFYSANSSRIGSSLYRYISTSTYGGSYSTYNASNGLGTPSYVTRNIATQQGFMVKASSSGSLSFTRAMTSNNTTRTFMKEEESVLPAVRLAVINEGELKDECLAVMHSSSTDQGSDIYDSDKFFAPGDGNQEIYFTDLMAFDRKMAINSLPEFTQGTIIPVGLSISGLYKVKVNELANIPNGLNVYLEDRKAKTTIKLNQNDMLTLTKSDEEASEGRYFLRFGNSAEAISANQAAQLGYTYVEYGTIRIYLNNSGVNAADANIYDMAGKLIAKTNLINNNGTNSLNGLALAPGVYVVKVKTDNGGFVSRVVIE